ncbi:MAG: hypothetical protein KDC95_11645 [Planctomycetes bacterium]|nr:hypothetical protein [Planctomycetota bacterium]
MNIATQTRFASRSLQTITTAFLLGLTACGGGGGGGGGTTSDVNQGSYDKDAFSYQDPYAPEFQPLQTAVFRATRQEELAVFAGGDGKTPWGLAFDDTANASRPLSLFSTSVLPAGFAARASAAGAADDVRGDEVVVIGQTGTDLEAITLTSDTSGQWSNRNRFSIPGTNLGYRDIDVKLIDVDGDTIDEIVLSATFLSAYGGFVRIYDDEAAGNKLLRNIDIAGSWKLDVVPFDADGDGTSELLLFNRQSASAQVAVLEGASKDFAIRYDWVDVDRYGEAAVAGNFDDDGDLEFAVVTYGYISGNYRSYVKFYDFVDGKPVEFESVEVLVGARSIYDAVAVDTNRDGVDEVAAAIRYWSGSRYYSTFGHVSPKADAGPRANNVFVRHILSTPVHVRLATFDGDADGREEVAMQCVYTSSSGSYYTHSCIMAPFVQNDGKFTFEYRYLNADAIEKNTNWATLAVGDFDRENLVLRSTGKKWLDLPDPMPIVVMAAPPTKEGVSQNFDNSQTAYGTEQSQERSHGVTTGWTASFSVGFEAEDIFGVFGASAKQTIATSMKKTLTNSRKVTWTKTFSGSYDNDTIIFQGTLYQCYEYEIVSAEDANLVGSKITLNDPVATKIYKWTVDFYNQNVATKARIDDTVLSHTVGDPKSYIRKADAATKLTQAFGWVDEGLEVGAVRGGTNSTSVSVTTANSSEKSRSFSIDWEAEVKIGGATIGGSFGLESESVYGVTLETGTTYEGTVGDIENTSQWSDWRYSFGLLVYRHGADGDGATMRGQRPYQVITYWVDDLGPSYR